RSSSVARCARSIIRSLYGCRPRPPSCERMVRYHAPYRGTPKSTPHRRMTMPASRVLPSPEAADLIALARTIATKEPAPRVHQAEARGEFPREVFRALGRAGLLGLPYPEAVGGGGQPYEVYLQVLEEVASVWASIGVGTSVHTLSCFGVANYDTPEQQ